jgi:hypothetical protein
LDRWLATLIELDQTCISSFIILTFCSNEFVELLIGYSPPSRHIRTFQKNDGRRLPAKAGRRRLLEKASRRRSRQRLTGEGSPRRPAGEGSRQRPGRRRLLEKIFG